MASVSFGNKSTGVSPFVFFGKNNNSMITNVFKGIKTYVESLKSIENKTENTLFNRISQNEQLNPEVIRCITSEFIIPKKLKIIDAGMLVDQAGAGSWKVLESTFCKDGDIGIMPVILQPHPGNFFAVDHIIAIIVDRRCKDDTKIIIFDAKGSPPFEDNYWKRQVKMYYKDGKNETLEKLRIELMNNFPASKMFVNQQRFQYDGFNCGVYYFACVKLMIELVETSNKSILKSLIKCFKNFNPSNFRKFCLETLRLEDDWVLTEGSLCIDEFEVLEDFAKNDSSSSSSSSSPSPSSSDLEEDDFADL